jgi:hypothetical protein
MRATSAVFGIMLKWSDTHRAWLRAVADAATAAAANAATAGILSPWPDAQCRWRLRDVAVSAGTGAQCVRRLRENRVTIPVTMPERRNAKRIRRVRDIGTSAGGALPVRRGP